MTSTPTRPVDNVVIATKGLQDRNINILAGTTVEIKGKLILLKECSTLNIVGFRRILGLFTVNIVSFILVLN